MALNAVERATRDIMIVDYTVNENVEKYEELFVLGEIALRELIKTYIVENIKPEREKTIIDSQAMLDVANQELTRIDTYLTNQGIDTK